ncbi:hypothetical protein [Syntrophomonas palmitatica]|uniref:hypothetical protein n=1 Tax=Syntrophomonas palmitatica TaxID=402877 RepID=UPI0012ED5B03|nr:hypothetical protein [Syntrophomonas palmitatica]
MDRRNSFAKKLMNSDRVDPGTFSFLEPGWWALHAATIAGVYALGSMIAHSEHRHHH